ncbi:hypothetical protein NCAS_0A09130 [Naumovozyma castellii]|uniref:Arrestin C-terminal-like domain-containing protein n=1 Tax=Naumovozyma castellii TaxID=27288 RepID=G0V7M3_NAUCA|nr:hypothetical protein NCAS_0A09130 [Naumovozyma castellii CBS 4309]CCC67471.1 hypothetical protein NCAS_0A09130 [Naumovozyma castellii CBS 4309]
MSIFFRPPLDIEITLDNEEARKHVDLPTNNKSNIQESLPLYEDGESLSGVVTLRVKEGKRVDHLGVKIAVVGSIDMVKTHGGSNGSVTGNKISPNASALDSRKKTVDQFLCMSYDLCPAEELQHTQSFTFNFKDVNKRYEAYRGKNVDVSYYVKVTVLRKSTDISKTKRFWVYLYKDLIPQQPPTTVQKAPSKVQSIEEPVEEEASNSNGTDASDVNDNGESSIAAPPPSNSANNNESHPVKLDIGIENCLHIEFEFSKARYTLKDVIVGRIYFLLTRLKIKHMELSLITRESSGLQPSNYLIDSTAIRYGIMDGSPVKGESIPIRLFLGGYDLIPNMSCNYFNVKNYLSLVIIDEAGRRYFKQSEIILYRTR